MALELLSVRQDGAKEGKERDGTYVAFYHSSRLYLDSIDRLFHGSHFLKLKIVSSEPKLDPMLLFLMQKRTVVVVDGDLTDSEPFIEDIRSYGGAEVRIIQLTAKEPTASVRKQKNVSYFHPNQPLVDLVAIMLEPLDVTETNANPLPILDGALTDKEWDILSLIISGYTRKEMAKRLSRSVKTIDNHRSHIMEKLGIKGSNAMFAKYAHDRGWRF